jgi:hypothetical protein
MKLYDRDAASLYALPDLARGLLDCAYAMDSHADHSEGVRLLHRVVDALERERDRRAALAERIPGVPQWPMRTVP